MKKIWISLIIILVVVVVSLLIVRPWASNPKTIKIGAILPLTGDAATYGKALQKGIDLAVIEINNKNGISNQKVTIVYEDSRADSKTAISAINKLISIDKVPIIIGDMFSSTTLSIAPIAQKNGIVLISPTASAEAVPAVGDHIFTIYPLDSYDGQFLGEHLPELWANVHRVAIVYNQSEATITCKEAFKASIKQKYEVVAEEATLQGVHDLSLVIPKIFQSKPDVVFLATYMPETALFLRQAHEQGMKAQYLGISTCYDLKIFELAGKTVDGLVFSAPYFDAESQSSRIVRFVTNFNAKYASKANVWAAYGYDVIQIVALSLSQVSSRSISLRDAIAMTKNFNGLTGLTTFNPNRTVSKELLLMVADAKVANFLPVSNSTFQK